MVLSCSYGTPIVKSLLDRVYFGIPIRRRKLSLFISCTGGACVRFTLVGYSSIVLKYSCSMTEQRITKFFNKNIFKKLFYSFNQVLQLCIKFPGLFSPVMFFLSLFNIKK